MHWEMINTLSLKESKIHDHAPFLSKDPMSIPLLSSKFLEISLKFH